jgi:hypothetical protein
MSNLISWPMTPATFGGITQIEKRVKVSMRDTGAGSYALVESGGRQGLKVEFWRGLYSAKLEFRGAGLNGLGLVSAEVRSLISPESSLSIMVRTGRRKNGRVGVAFDNDRGYMVAFDRMGEVESLALPFARGSMNGVPHIAKQMYALGGCTLASWAMTFLVALCRSDDKAIAEVIEVLKDMQGETEGQFDDLVKEHDLMCGDGSTRLRLNPGNSRLL